MKKDKEAILGSIYKLLYLSIEDENIYSEVSHLKEHINQLFEKNVVVSKTGIKNSLYLKDDKNELTGSTVYTLKFEVTAEYAAENEVPEKQIAVLKNMLTEELMIYLEKLD